MKFWSNFNVCLISYVNDDSTLRETQKHTGKIAGAKRPILAEIWSWTKPPVHVGIFDCQRKGLHDVAIRNRGVPS